MKKHIPVVGILVSAVLLVIAASRYPGGSMASSESVGYSWTENTLSALFQPTAVNGDRNPARSFAVAAVLVYCFSMASVFVGIAVRSASRRHFKAIQIGGIGAMIYAALSVTPMHDLMVAMALPFFAVAVFAVLHSQLVGGRKRLFGVGLICVSLPLINAAMYYGDLFYGMLPIVQKLGTAACAGWLLASYYSAHGDFALSVKAEVAHERSPSPMNALGKGEERRRARRW